MTPPDVLDVAIVLRDAKTTSTALQTLKVRTPEQLAAVNACVVEAKRTWKLLDDQRKLFTKPAREIEAQAKATFGPTLDALKLIEDQGKRLLVEHDTWQRAEQAKQLAEASAAFVAGDSTAGVTALARVPETVAVKGTSYRTKQTIEVVDANLVPRELCSPDLVKIKAALALGQRVPGVKVTEEKIASVRT